jgi:BrnA antitoxin of type II toxin-antitoxin system
MAQEYDFSKGKRGAVAPGTTGKTRITIRLDDEVLEWFRDQVHAAGGGNYQSLINLALREHMKRSREQLEETLRRILREEFHGESARHGRVRRKAPMKKTALRKVASK